MSWFSENILDTGGKDKPQQPVKQTAPKEQTPTVFVESGGPAPTINAGGDPGIFRKHFEDLLAQNNIPGNDYYEFVAVKNHLAAIPDEEQRYKAAYAGLSAAGLTKDILIQTATKYKNLIDRELADFEATYQQQYRNDVTNKRQAITDKQKAALELSNQLAQISAEITKLKEETSSAGDSLLGKHDAFVSSGKEAKEKIETELNKINQYIN